MIVSEANPSQIRVLHVVSSGAIASSLQQSLFMPLLIRTPKQRVKVQVACLAPDVVPAAVLRQNGIPVHEIALSRRRFALRGLAHLVKAARAFRPDIIQAWGHTAQIASMAVRRRCGSKPKVIWSIANTAPLARNAGFIDRRKLKWAVKRAAAVDRIVYSSESCGSHHRRAGFPDDTHAVIAPGVDAARFKPDPAARRKMRAQLHLDANAFVLGMVAPFQPEYDHTTFLKATGELIKTNPNVAVVLAGHGAQKGNAALMALVGGGALGGRMHMLGEWSDLASLFNACDVVCSSALNDSARMTLAAAMLCGVPCVGTGIGAQGEVIGHFGVAIEAGNPAAFVRGLTRVMQLTPERRAAMAQGARKHALQNYVYVRSLQKYLQLYCDLIGRQEIAPPELPAVELQATVSVATSAADEQSAPRKGPVIAELADPDSLEEKVREHAEPLPKWRLEQEEQRTKREQELARRSGGAATAGDVLAVFEEQLAKPGSAPLVPMQERARGIVDEVEELLPAEVLSGAATQVPPSQPRPASTESVLPASAVQSAAEAAQPTQLALVEAVEPSAVPSQAPQESVVQLELLSDPVEDRKRAIGKSG